MDGISISTLPVKFSDFAVCRFSKISTTAASSSFTGNRAFFARMPSTWKAFSRKSPLSSTSPLLCALFFCPGRASFRTSPRPWTFTIIFFCHLGIDLEIYSYQQLLSTYRSYEEMVAGIMEAMTPDVEKEISEGGYSRGFLKIIKYIHENYSTDISTAGHCQRIQYESKLCQPAFQKRNRKHHRQISDFPAHAESGRAFAVHGSSGICYQRRLRLQ